jgi:hypothetical protein
MRFFALVAALPLVGLLAASTGVALEPGRVSGQVLDADGQPVAGATVFALATTFPGGTSNAVTDDDGRYEITNAAGVVRVQAVAPDGSPWLWEYWTSTGGTRDEDGAELLTVPEEGLVTDIDFQLDRGASVSGRLTSETGQPMGYMAVNLRTIEGRYGGFALTDAAGYYTVMGVAPDPSYVIGTDEGFGYLRAYFGSATTALPTTGFSAELGETIVGKDIQMRRAAMAAFTVTPAAPDVNYWAIVCPGDTTVAVSSFTIVCGNSAAGFTGWVYSGRGLLTELELGTYTIAAFNFYSGSGPSTTFTVGAATDATTCMLAAGDTGIESSCTTVDGGRINGRVTGPDYTRPDALTQITAYNVTTGAVAGLTIANGNGYYSMRGLASGTFKLEAQLLSSTALAGEFYSDATTLVDATPVVVDAGTASTGVNFSLERGITGTVQFVDVDGEPVAPGPLSGPVLCQDFINTYTCEDGRVPPFAAISGQVGKYTVGPFSPGTYLVRPIVDIRKITDDAPITFASGDTFSCTVTLPEGPTTCTVFFDPTNGSSAPSDSDGVDDAVEDGAPNGGDGNSDQIPDAEQVNVTSLPAVDSSAGYLTIAVTDAELSTVSVEPVDDTAPPPGASSELGIVSFQVTGIEEGSTHRVTILLPEGVAAPTGYAKLVNGVWNVLPPNYYDLSVPGVITLVLTDGDPLVDADGEANGTIIDPGTPLMAPATPPLTFSGFQAPVDMGVVNTMKAGSTVPLKFQMFRGIVESTSVEDVANFRVVTSSECTSTTTSDEVETLTSGATQLRYTNTGFVQNWQTPKRPGCFRATVTSTDGSELSALFRIR